MTRGPDPKVTIQDVWDLIEFGIPETAATLAEELPCHPDTVFNRLEELENEGHIKKKKISDKSVVWWKPDHNPVVDPERVSINTASKKDPEIIGALAESKREGEPMASKEIAEEINETKDIVYNRLRKLEERGLVDSLKAGSTGRAWWLSETEMGGEGGQTSLSLSPALKSELKQVRDNYDNPQTLEDTVTFVMKYPDITGHQIEGNEENLEPIKVSERTRDYLRYLRDKYDHPDYEAVIRSNADISPRKANVKYVELTPPGERSIADGNQES